jgi:hypothetical protein
MRRQVTPDLPYGAALNLMFTMSAGSNERDGIFAADLLFRYRRRHLLSVRLIGLCHDPAGRERVSIIEKSQDSDSIGPHSRFSRSARASVGAR